MKTPWSTEKKVPNAEKNEPSVMRSEHPVGPHSAVHCEGSRQGILMRKMNQSDT